MKVTSAEALAALKLARGDRSWSQFAASAPPDRDGKILVERYPQRVVAVDGVSHEEAGGPAAADPEMQREA